MKRIDLIRHLERNGCAFLREGHAHTIYINPTERCISAIPRHRKIKNMLVLKICKDLKVSSP
jgi:predicted RNA binding protein YcfA (HicA-like mRNA interferase family)